MPALTQAQKLRKAKMERELAKLQAIEDEVDANEDEVDANEDEVDANEDEVDANDDDVDAEDEEVDANDDEIDAEEEEVDAEDDEVEARVALFQGLPEAKGQQRQAAALAREGVSVKSARNILRASGRTARAESRKDHRVTSGGRGNSSASSASKDASELSALARKAGFRAKRTA